MITRDTVLSLMNSLNLPDPLVRVYFDEPLWFSWISDEFRIPHEFFSFSAEEQNTLVGDSLVPFWTDTSFLQLRCFDIKRHEFARVSTEKSNYEDAARLNWDSLLVDDFLNWWELEKSDADLIKAAAIVRFPQIQRLLAELKRKRLKCKLVS